eukprot:138717_1
MKSSPLFADDTNKSSLLQAEPNLEPDRLLIVNGNANIGTPPTTSSSPINTSSTFQDFHRDLGDGGFRGAIFGFSDGLATNLCLVIGVQVSLNISSTYHIIMTGIAGLLAGAFSMGCGEYISMKAQSEAMLNEINRERGHLQNHWKQEMDSLRRTLKQTVELTDETISKIVQDLSHSHRKESCLLFHAKMELNLDPADQGNPWKTAVYSFICFSVGAFIPLIPYFIFEDNTLSCKVSIGSSVFISLLLGIALGMLNGVLPINCAFRQIFAICFSVACSVGINYGFASI